MNISHLSCFLALCETMNYTTAAERCYISRQAMCQIIKKLEDAYGLPLIQNHKNHLSLTPAGQLLRQKAQAVLRAYDELEAAMRGCIHPASPLRLGLSRSLLPFYAPSLPAALDRFHAAYPHIPLSPVLMSADDAAAHLSQGELDAVIAVDTGSVSLPVERIPLRHDPLGILLSQKHPLAAKDALSPSDLSNLPVNVMGAPEVFFSVLTHLFLTAGAQPQWQIVPEYVDVCRNIRDAHTVGIDMGEDTPGSLIDVCRILPLTGEPLKLHTALLLRPDAPPSAHLLAAFLAQQSL